jgi:hypothetical protein
MDKLILDYYNHITNVLNLGNGFVLGREVTKGIEHITVEFEGVLVYSFWHNPNKKLSKNPPKHTGGKPSYVKQFLKEMQNHKELSIEAAGFIQKVLPNIDWGSNLLIDQRSKKRLAVDDMCKVINKSKPFTIKVLKELTTAQLLSKDKDGYKISPNLIQKGGTKDVRHDGRQN